MKKLKVAFIGTGGIALKTHIPSILKMENAEIVALCDVSEEALNRASDVAKDAEIFTDYKKMLEIDEIEVVHICTPNFLHEPNTIDSLKAGKHVLVEKPLGRNVEEGERIVETAKASGKKFMVGQCFRYTTEAQLIKKFIASGDLGDIYYARIWALRRRGIPGWGVFTDKEKQGGGPLIDIGIHGIDQALYLMGNPKPVSVFGQVFTKIGNTPGHVGNLGAWDHTKFTVEDFAAGFVKLDNGASLSIESSFAANIAEDRLNSAILGSKGGAETNPCKIFTENHGALLDITPACLKMTNIYEAEIKDFYDCIINDTEPPITGEQALDVIKIIEGIYKSSEEGREIKIS